MWRCPPGCILQLCEGVSRLYTAAVWRCPPGCILQLCEGVSRLYTAAVWRCPPGCILQLCEGVSQVVYCSCVKVSPGCILQLCECVPQVVYCSCVKVSPGCILQLCEGVSQVVYFSCVKVSPRLYTTAVWRCLPGCILLCNGVINPLNWICSRYYFITISLAWWRCPSLEAEVKRLSLGLQLGLIWLASCGLVAFLSGICHIP